MSDETIAPVMVSSPHPAVTVTTLSPAFKLVFITILALTVLALTMNAAFAVSMHQFNDQQKSLLDTCSTITKTGFGAIVGLVGGKAIG